MAKQKQLVPGDCKTITYNFQFNEKHYAVQLDLAVNESGELEIHSGKGNTQDAESFRVKLNTEVSRKQIMAEITEIFLKCE